MPTADRPPPEIPPEIPPESPPEIPDGVWPDPRNSPRPAPPGVPPAFEDRFPPDGLDELDALLALEPTEPRLGWAAPGGARPATALPTTGRRVRLVVPADRHLLPLWGLATDPYSGFRWRHNGMGIGPQEFADQLWRGVTCQFVAEHLRRDDLVGWVLAYGLNQRNQHVSIAVLGADAYRATPALWEGVYLFVRYLFGNLCLRKVYAEVPEYNLATFASGIGKVFEIEGRLRDHLYHDGCWWDQYLVAIDRPRFESVTERFGRWLAGDDLAGDERASTSGPAATDRGAA